MVESEGATAMEMGASLAVGVAAAEAPLRIVERAMEDGVSVGRLNGLEELSVGTAAGELF